jgi:hypothetical protein
MDAVLLLLAIAGFLAVLRAASRAALGLLVRGVEVVMTGEATDISARRGDLTGLSAADERHDRARRGRRRSLLAVAAWVALLVLPAFTPWPRLGYAACSVLWFLPVRRR